MSPAKRIATGLMKGVYIATYPVSSYVLHNSQRVRVVVIAKEHILLQRSNFGLQRWSLPGGGIGKTETAQQAAVRETMEETGVQLSLNTLKAVGQRRLPPNQRWPQMNITFFGTRLSKQQTPAITHRFEILEARWFRLDDLPKKRSVTVDIGLELMHELA